MRKSKTLILALLSMLLPLTALASEDLSVSDDPLLRMPGTQPDSRVSLESPNRCMNCHAGYHKQVEPGFNWQGSMMAQAGRDFIFWSAMTVAAQDSVFALGNTNATDLCLRCHFPAGWLEGRSEPTNASAMVGSDYDGLSCDFCHRMYDPFHQATHDGTREVSGDPQAFWDETNLSSTPSDAAAAETLEHDRIQASSMTLFNGNPLIDDVTGLPTEEEYTEATSGQFFISTQSQKRASFADAEARHQILYSRFHKSKYFCATCHDVSNPALANLELIGTLPGDGTTVLPTEAQSAHNYLHVERTFSEFMSSAYGRGAGSEGLGYFAPDVFDTSNPGNVINKCQDCHMRDQVGAGADKNGVPVRPDDSIEHPASGQPVHDLTGGNAFVPYVLASTVVGSPNYDAENDRLLNQGPDVLTLDLSQGLGLNPEALLAAAERAKQQLSLAAAIGNLTYQPSTGQLDFRLQNQTGHRLLSGFPEGRRMIVNIKAYDASGNLMHEVNPYDAAAGTLKGLSYSYSPNEVIPVPQALAINESYIDALVYEIHPGSTLTGELESFHFVLSDTRYKDNRIPPKGYDVVEAEKRISLPVDHGVDAPDLYTAAEYAGGYDDVSLTLPAGAAGVEVKIYYQTTSREYATFLRDEIEGTGNLTLPASAYIAQTDPFFAKLKAWGTTFWDLWVHNMNVPGAAPILMTQATFGDVTGGGGCTIAAPTLDDATPDNKTVSLTWSAVGQAEGYDIFHDLGSGKAQLIGSVSAPTTSYVDADLTNGLEYCYQVSATEGSCQSALSNTLCATPYTSGQQPIASATDMLTGTVVVTGKGKNQTSTFVAGDAFAAGNDVIIRGTIRDASGNPIEGATFTLSLVGAETADLVSAASDANGEADAIWETSSPNKKGNGGTATGSYTASVTGITASGFEWDGVTTSVTFTLQ